MSCAKRSPAGVPLPRFLAMPLFQALKRISAAHMQITLCMWAQVRDEIEAVLGREASVKEVLLAMCDRRLVPTPWLNQARALRLFYDTRWQRARWTALGRPLPFSCQETCIRRPAFFSSCMPSCPAQGFREPLYLTDKPVVLLDDRTEEEIKYPELFRHRARQTAVPDACRRLLTK